MPFYVASDGAKLFYEDEGTGSPLLMIHGWSGSHQCFDTITPTLKDHYRVIAVDLRGHGSSANSALTERGLTLKKLGQDLQELLDALNLEQVFLLGWSMGCSVIYDYIRQFGCCRIRRLVLVDMSPKTINEGDWTYGRSRQESFRDAVFWSAECAKNWDNAVEFFVPTLYANGVAGDPEDVRYIIDISKKNAPHSMVDLLLSMSVNDYRDVLKKITVPTLLLHGEDSILYGKEHGEYLVNQISSARLYTMPGGHIMFREHPEQFLAAVTEFFDETAFEHNQPLLGE